MNSAFWCGKSVFVTGHMGFKGGWLCHWLCDLGARVHGFSLGPPTEPNFFTEVRLEDRLETSTSGDVLNLAGLRNALIASKAAVVFHLAAQPLVRESYLSPVDTYMANVIGTVNLLEACRAASSVVAIVNVTSDKCYRNDDWRRPFRETAPLGGRDPYSSSKACAEIVTETYRRSFLSELGKRVASVRAGNVIGGGDWAHDRLVPDCLRALDDGRAVQVRSPNAVRPWQHVIEPLSGYLMLAEKLYAEGERYAAAWNFGPNEADAKPVSWIVEKLSDAGFGVDWLIDHDEHPHEARVLRLDISKAKSLLGWTPQWDLEAALEKTREWHQSWRKKSDMVAVTSEHIEAHVAE